MGGGENFLVQELDLVVLSTSLTFLVAVTVILELGLHQLRHWVRRHSTGKEMLQKVISELMILGIISFSTVMVVAFEGDDENVTQYLAEFEIAHIWLFFVGLLYVVHAIGFTYHLRTIKREWDRMDKIPVDVVRQKMCIEEHTADAAPTESTSQVEASGSHKWSRARRHRCMYLWCGSGNSTYAEAEFKVLRLFFIQQHWDRLERELGSYAHVKHFDYAQYVRSIVSQEIMALLEVHPLTWGIFLVLLWVIIGIRELAGLRYTNAIAEVNVGLGWALLAGVAALVIESHVGMQRLHKSIALAFPSLEPGKCETVEALFEQMAEKGIFDRPRVKVAVEAGTREQKQEKEQDQEQVEEEDMEVKLEEAADVSADGVELTVVVDNQKQNRGNASLDGTSDGRRGEKKGRVARSNSVLRVQSFRRVESRRLMSFDPRTMSRFSEIIMFLQCFMIAMLFLINTNEVSNATKHYGILATAGVNGTSSSSSSSAVASSTASSSSGRRMLLASSSSSGSGDGAAWRFCRDYDTAAADSMPSWYLFTDIKYTGAPPFTLDGVEYTCYVYSAWYSPLTVILALIPQALIALVLQPIFIKNYCYFAAVTMGGFGEQAGHGHKGGHGNDDGDEDDDLDPGSHDHHDHHGRLDAAVFEQILHIVFEKMRTDEHMIHAYRSHINEAVKRRATTIAHAQQAAEANAMAIASVGDEAKDGGANKDMAKRRRSRRLSFLQAPVYQTQSSSAPAACTPEMYREAQLWLFHEIDEDDSGEVSYSELKAGLQKLSSATGRSLGFLRSQKQWKRLLRMLDPDQSGAISQEEFIQYLRADHYDFEENRIEETAMQLKERLETVEAENVELRAELEQLRGAIQEQQQQQQQQQQQ